MAAQKPQKEFVQSWVERSGGWDGFRCVCRQNLVMCFAGFAGIAGREILEFGFEGVVAATAADIVLAQCVEARWVMIFPIGSRRVHGRYKVCKGLALAYTFLMCGEVD